MLMNAKTTGRKATQKTASQTPRPKRKSAPGTPLTKAAAATVPGTPVPSRHRGPAKARPRIASAAPLEPVGTSKQDRLIALLSALPGATIDQMMTLTGWQAHTLRGTISGVLRKKLGLIVTCGVFDASGQRLYCIGG
jgi:hypothetical protein